MAAPQGNQHNSKGGDCAAANINIRCRQSDKNKWTRAAKRQNHVRNGYGRPSKKLAAWVVHVLNAAADRELRTQAQAVRVA